MASKKKKNKNKKKPVGTLQAKDFNNTN